jgi:hypothetical protein
VRVVYVDHDAVVLATSESGQSAHMQLAVQIARLEMPEEEESDVTHRRGTLPAEWLQNRIR